MPRGAKTVTVEKSKASNYKTVADNFYKGAETAAEHEYWNAAGVLIVHAAIAYGDAVTIKYGGVKSKGEDHQQLVNLIEEKVAYSEERKKALLQLNKIIAHKNSVSYSGDIYGQKDIEKLKKHIDRFRSWVISVIK
ncbi:MAG TPA: HEPN domain-containing protein [Ignavibacteria bacterium]|nr:HEPN domain-containing protein [Ignavibacteria bacterium]